MTAFALYLQDVDRRLPLTPAEESRLGALLPDAAARQKLIESNLRFVITIAKAYQNRTEDLEDLVEAGNLGLCRAADKFDVRKGYRFITYAVWWIRQAILTHLGNVSLIRIPSNRYKDLYGAFASVARIEQKIGRSLSVSELLDVYDGIFDMEALTPKSLDAPRTDCPDNRPLMSFLSSDVCRPDGEFARTQRQSVIDRALECLDLRSRDMVMMHFWDGLAKTEVAEIYGLSKERVRQVIDMSLKRLRKKRVLEMVDR